jgi:hypothetical protein
MSGENIESLMDSNNHISDNFQELLNISQRMELSNAATEQASASLEAGIDMDTISREIPAPKPVHTESVHVPVVEERYEPQPMPVQKSPVFVPEPIPAPATPIADTKPVAAGVQARTVKSTVVSAEGFAKSLVKRRKIAKQSFPVIALSSFYKSRMKSISLAAKEALLDSSSTPHEVIERQASTIYNLLSDVSVGTPSYKIWKQLTSLNDLDTFFFGIFGATYPGESEFTLKCSNGKCGRDFKTKLRPSDFIVEMAEESVQRMDEINRLSHTFAELAKYSPVSETKEYFFGDDAEIKVTSYMSVSIDRYIETIKHFSTREIQEHQDIITITATVKSAGVRVDDNTSVDEAVYEETSDIRSIFELLRGDDFSPDWAGQIEKDITDITKPLTVSYKIPKSCCPHCQHESEPVNISAQNMLFFKLEGKKM